MNKRVALVGAPPDAAWAEIVTAVVTPLGLGPVDVSEAAEMTGERLTAGYELALIDTAGIEDPLRLVTEWHQAQPALPIIVFSSSLTWRRARDMFLVGAADYVRKTFEPQMIQQHIVETLERAGRR